MACVPQLIQRSQEGPVVQALDVFLINPRLVAGCQRDLKYIFFELDQLKTRTFMRGQSAIKSDVEDPVPICSELRDDLLGTLISEIPVYNRETDNIGTRKGCWRWRFRGNRGQLR